MLDECIDAIIESGLVSKSFNQWVNKIKFVGLIFWGVIITVAQNIYRTMQKRLPFVPSEQNVTYSICLLFNSRGTHLPVSWSFPISRGRSETARWVSANCSASCFLVRPRMLFVRYKFRLIEHNNTTLCTHFSNSSLARVWHSSTTQQKDAVSNLVANLIVAQTAPVHHLLPKIRVSYLYTRYHSWVKRATRKVDLMTRTRGEECFRKKHQRKCRETTGQMW